MYIFTFIHVYKKTLKHTHTHSNTPTQKLNNIVKIVTKKKKATKRVQCTLSNRVKSSQQHSLALSQSTATPITNSTIISPFTTTTTATIHPHYHQGEKRKNKRTHTFIFFSLVCLQASSFYSGMKMLAQLHICLMKLKVRIKRATNDLVISCILNN